MLDACDFLTLWSHIGHLKSTVIQKFQGQSHIVKLRQNMKYQRHYHFFFVYAFKKVLWILYIWDTFILFVSDPHYSLYRESVCLSASLKKWIYKEQIFQFVWLKLE